MSEYVFDTLVLSWYLGRPSRLGRRALRALQAVDRGEAAAWIPAIIGVELALLAEGGASTISQDDLETTIERNPRIRVLPLDLEQAREFGHLVRLIDPFDRLIVAAARVLGCALLTADARITESGLVPVIWD